jgi:hypothetical protein
MSCRTIYAPALVGGVACPKCADPRWEPSAIPNSDDPLSLALTALAL